MAIATINPTTGETVKTFDPLTEAEIDGRLDRAAHAFRSYRLTTFAQRAEWLNASARILDDECDDIARTMTLEMGKTLVSARAEVQKCARAARYFASNAEQLLASEPADAGAVGASRAYAIYQPLGPVLAVMPWNFPLWQVMRFAAPGLMAGNVGLLKHASNVPQTALILEDVFRRGGFPDGVFQTLLIGSDAVEGVLRDSRVVAATLTGSTGAGTSIARIAGSEIKKTVLELGGSDPFVVMPSADLDEAARVAVIARCQNNGQSCIAAKRFIVHDDVFDAFTERFIAGMSALQVGDPMVAGTDVGPLATEAGRADVEQIVDAALGDGARALCGGKRTDGPGWFYPPSVITDIEPKMAMFGEEVFGPVAALFRVRDLDEAVALSNATVFGLGSNIWTREAADYDRFVRDVEAGGVFVNGMTTSYPELPFGGVHASGYGRELSAHGIHEFCNIKTVWIGPSAQNGLLRNHGEPAGAVFEVGRDLFEREVGRELH
jgi:succinate-semialdehyde dehydrogenase/glutarate-semialdehyde dehydrogenase